MEVVRFNKKIYSLEAVKMAIEEFKNLANFSFKEADKYIEVKIDKMDKDCRNIIKDEFANYVLGSLS